MVGKPHYYILNPNTSISLNRINIYWEKFMNLCVNRNKKTKSISL